MKSQDGIRSPNYYCPTLNGSACWGELNEKCRRISGQLRHQHIHLQHVLVDVTAFISVPARHHLLGECDDGDSVTWTRFTKY